ncbi:damaged DNA-binding protein [Lithospermum erythrorhizon]|uniref:Damaged DNA-binding protein n=1 Tax=Lithospermum erythrorhizon TaxID=34254 RepID=A0AAV3R7H3_LITER
MQVPSMRQLHLHVISQDFSSKHLKNKKHWNAFYTPFFRDSVDGMEEVSKNGKPALVDDESFLKKELRCHRCRSAHPKIPRLKSHITSCPASFPSALQQNGRLILCSGKTSFN